MKYWVGLTDKRWFDYLSPLAPDEVNFWQPGGNRAFRAIEPGSPFLFKLHSPLNYIVGGGYFVRYSALPISLAWEAFGENNGAPNIEVLRDLIRKHRDRRNHIEHDPIIGCVILNEPFFFKEYHWIPIPEDWHRGIQQGKRYDSTEASGGQLWARVEEIRRAERSIVLGELSAEETARYGSLYLARTRLGQGAFRVLVTEAYHRRCAVTGERTLPVLEAAHIKPYSESGPNRTANGLLLRSDLHKLFDLGYVTLTADLHIEVSKRIREEYENGRDYYVLHGRRLVNVLSNPNDRPASNFLEWHNQHAFLG